MENCTIYSHQIGLEKIENIIQKTLPQAEIKTKDNKGVKSLIVSLKSGLFGKKKNLKINYRQRTNPSYQLKEIECDVTQNLAGMVNYIQTIPTEHTEIRNRFLYKVMAANSEIACIADPAIDPNFSDVIKEMVKHLDAFVFAQPGGYFRRSTTQHFLNSDLELILDKEGRCDVDHLDVNIDSKYHDLPTDQATQEQINRKKKSQEYLYKHEIKINENLPVTLDAKIRNQNEIVERTYALLIIAAKGEGVPIEQLNQVIEDKSIKGFSEKEKEILKTVELTDEDKAYATWRYEGLNVMLWALGILPELKYPNEICGVETIVGKIIKPSRDEFESLIKLRDTQEIVDELDKTYRMHWACVDARISGQPVSGNLNAGIVYERHYAFNWLTNYQNQSWDEVSTDT